VIAGALQPPAHQYALVAARSVLTAPRRGHPRNRSLPPQRKGGRLQPTIEKKTASSQDPIEKKTASSQDLTSAGNLPAPQPEQLAEGSRVHTAPAGPVLGEAAPGGEGLMAGGAVQRSRRAQPVAHRAHSRTGGAGATEPAGAIFRPCQGGSTRQGGLEAHRGSAGVLALAVLAHFRHPVDGALTG
jgi:hypothetical protein